MVKVSFTTVHDCPLWLKCPFTFGRTGNFLATIYSGSFELSTLGLTHFCTITYDFNPFSRVCELCYRKLNLLLIAVQVSKSNGGQQLLINPGSHIKLKPGCLGFFIAESAKEVKRANVWCARCHANVSDPEDIRRCGCPHNVKVNATSHLDIHEV